MLKKKVCEKCHKIKTGCKWIGHCQADWRERMVWCMALKNVGGYKKINIDNKPPEECYYYLEQIV